MNSISSIAVVVLLFSMCYINQSKAEASQCVSLYSSETQTKSYSDIDVKKLRGKYRSLEQKIYWKSYVEDITDVTQLIHKNHQQKNADKGSPKKNFELFGIENYKAFVEARDFLNSIPEGSLHMSPELIKKVHVHSSGVLKAELNPIQKIFSWLFVEPGVYKKRNNTGNDPLSNPLTEEQYIALKANPYTKFVERPWPLSRPNKRRGYILYGDKNNVEKDIQDLCNWTNDQLAKIRTGDADAIKVAAEFQWRYVSIHPMIDGNGRNSMLLANRILEEADLPPIMMTMSGYDIYYPISVWAEKIKAAIFEFETMINDPGFKASLEKETPNLYMVNFSDGPRMGLTPKSFRGAERKSAVEKLNKKILTQWPLLKRELFAEDETQEVNIGNQRFVAMFDGFLYNKHGIPHSIQLTNVDGNKTFALYPVADQTAYMYSMGGTATTSKRFFRRGMNPFMRDHYRSFFAFMKQYKNSGAEFAKDISVGDYSKIESANKNGTLFLYDWQRPLLKHALEIKDTDPMLILSPTRGYHTQFEKSVHYGDKTNLHEILAQYQLMELRFYKFEQHALKNGLTEEAQIAQQSRKKLFDAAKTLLTEKVIALEKALEESPELFPSSQEWQFFLSYYRVTPMKYSSFEEFTSSRDAGKITLLRADQGASKFIGFVSNTFFRNFLDSIPTNQEIKAYVGKMNQAVEADAPTAEQIKFLETSIAYKLVKSKFSDTKRVLRNFNRVIQMSKYDTRGMAKEFDRLSLEHYLHSVNDPFKTSVSFSSNSAIYIRTKKLEAIPEVESVETKDIIPFTFDSKDANVYFVKLNKADVDVNEASGYFRQYEILKPNIALPFKITDSFSNDFFSADGSTTTDKAELKRRAEFEAALVTVEGK